VVQLVGEVELDEVYMGGHKGSPEAVMSVSEPVQTPDDEVMVQLPLSDVEMIESCSLLVVVWVLKRLDK